MGNQWEIPWEIHEKWMERYGNMDGKVWEIDGKSMGNSGDSEPSLDFELWPTTWSDFFWLETRKF